MKRAIMLISVALLSVIAGVQTALAQKVTLHMAGNEKSVYDISRLDSITFDENDETADNNDVTIIVNEDGITPQGTIFTAINNNTFFVNYIKYTVKEGHLEVSGYDEIGLKSINGVAKIVSCIIYKGITYQVLEIGKNVFQYNSDITSISISNMVRNIGKYAFDRCPNLTSVSMGKSVTSIGGDAFYGCSRLTSVNIPESVTSIGSGAFELCFSLTSITIPSSVTSIGGCAFGGCYFLSSSYINNSALTDSNNWGPTLCDIETSDGLLIKDNVVVRCRAWAVSVTIPESVTDIRYHAFSDCSSLTSITIPNSVTSIDTHAFENCI